METFFDILRKRIQECYQEIGNKKVNKGVWRMPWLLMAKKDVITCDKHRGGGNIP
jgi:hypothetical protein